MRNRLGGHLLAHAKLSFWLGAASMLVPDQITPAALASYAAITLLTMLTLLATAWETWPRPTDSADKR